MSISLASHDVGRPCLDPHHLNARSNGYRAHTREIRLRRAHQILDACSVRSADQADLAGHIRQQVTKSGR